MIDNTIKCKTSKKRYDSPLGAKKAMFHLNYYFKTEGRKKNLKRYYLCPFCKGYHLTSK